MIKRIITVLAVTSLVAALAFTLAGCSKKDDTSSAQQNTPPAETSQNKDLYTPKYKPNGDEVAVITTNKGVIKVQLEGKDAPITVGNFVELAQKGFYDGTKFHRYEPDFVIQGGDPQTKDATPEEVIANAQQLFGTGDPGYKIKEEYTTNPNNKHLDGTLAMARSQDPDSAGSQFYFCLGAQSFLDPNYTVFGQTIEGLDVIHSLAAGDVIESITIENANS